MDFVWVSYRNCSRNLPKEAHAHIMLMDDREFREWSDKLTDDWIGKVLRDLRRHLFLVAVFVVGAMLCAPHAKESGSADRALDGFALAAIILTMGIIVSIFSAFRAWRRERREIMALRSNLVSLRTKLEEIQAADDIA